MGGILKLSLSFLLVLSVHGQTRSVCNRVSARSFCSYCHNDSFRSHCTRQCYECDHKDVHRHGSREEDGIGNGIVRKSAIIPTGSQPSVFKIPLTKDDVCPRKPNFEPCISPEEASKKAMKCCVDSPEIPEACYSRCRFNVTLDDLYTVYQEGGCPWSAVKVYMRCIMQGDVDIRPCCKAKGVFSQSNPDTLVCQNFCYNKLLPEKVPNEYEYFECLPHWQDIFQCYWGYLN